MATNEEHPILSRRTFVRGAAAVAASVSLAASFGLSGCSDSSEDEIEALVVDEANLVSFSDFTELDAAEYYTLEGSYILPAGSMLWMASTTFALVLTPGATSRPLSSLGLLDIGTGEYTSILAQAINSATGFEIYEARASSAMVAWTEYNYLSSSWKVYGAPFVSAGQLGDAVLFDEGSVDFDPPLLCVDTDCAIWSVLPYEYGPYKAEDSYVKARSVSATEANLLYTSHGRTITIPERSDNIVTIAPRADSDLVYYVLTALDPYSGEIVAQVTLPQGVRVANAIYMQGAFAFSIEASYDTESAITQVGTYFDLGDGTYFRLGKTPACTPAMCQGYLVVKSGKGTAVIKPREKTYFNLASPDRSWDYGDYLVSSGTCDKIVTYATVADADDASTATVLVRVFSVR
ncbi:MAG: hypothetical protein HGA54_02710 [Actinobacteria bacterium]|nr:hypothetical protein [Actinomycetota bacterium]